MSNSGFLDYAGLQYFKTRSDIIYAAALEIAGTTFTLKSKSGAILMSKSIDLSNYATKADVATAVRYKGSVNSWDNLPSSPTIGDMYNVVEASPAHDLPAGGNVIWDGSDWDVSGPMFDVEAISNASIDALF